MTRIEDLKAGDEVKLRMNGEEFATTIKAQGRKLVFDPRPPGPNPQHPGDKPVIIEVNGKAVE